MLVTNPYFEIRFATSIAKFHSSKYDFKQLLLFFLKNLLNQGYEEKYCGLSSANAFGFARQLKLYQYKVHMINSKG